MVKFNTIESGITVYSSLNGVLTDSIGLLLRAFIVGLVDESLNTEWKELRLDRFLFFGLLELVENRLEKGFYTAVRDILKGLR